MSAAASLPADDLPSLAEALARAERDRVRTVVTIGGRPVAALVPIEELADLQALDARENEIDAEAVREARAECEKNGDTWPRCTIEEIAAELGIDLAELRAS